MLQNGYDAVTTSAEHYANIFIDKELREAEVCRQKSALFEFKMQNERQWAAQR